MIIWVVLVTSLNLGKVKLSLSPWPLTIAPKLPIGSPMVGVLWQYDINLTMTKATSKEARGDH